VAAHLDAVASETLARPAPDIDGEGVVRGSVALEAGPAGVAIRGRDAAGRGMPQA
jgi:hypothetical protein